MKTTRKIVRLNEADLRGLVREMIGYGGGQSKEKALARVEVFNLDYQDALRTYGGDPDPEQLYGEFAPRLKAEVKKLLPMLGDGNGTVTVAQGYDDGLEIQVRYTQDGLPQRFSGSLENLVDRIDWAEWRYQQLSPTRRRTP